MLRKTLKTSLLVGLTVLSTMSFASVTDLEANVKVAGEKSFALYLNGLSTNVQIVLKDLQGHTLYKEEVENQESFAKRFNLLRLPEGDYSLRIQDSKIIKFIEFQIDGTAVIFQEEEVTYLPQAVATAGRVNIEMPSMNGSELNVFIKDEAGEVLFEEVVVNKSEGLKRTYDLSKIKPGDYKFVFYTNGYTVIKPVKIEN